ncbi:MAG TPA: TrmJ/YjtD family RNA methyltransferase [Candidatus Methanofastidiosa archaeon]|nr:TrmJ/YjtD family RNA methyltransferase [Candidatus Methanofastidiosa archaeon]
MISCILVEPESPGNIGSIARLMMNFGIKGPLILVNPPALNDEAYMMACNAAHLLDSSVVLDSFEKALGMVDVSISTSSEAGDEYNINRISLLPSDIVGAIDIDSSIGIIFGRESTGLTNEEISKTDMLVSIPTDVAYPAMNISHAAAILFHELYKHPSIEKRPIKLKGATRYEKDMLFDDFNTIVDSLEHRAYRQRNFKLVFRRVISRSFISSREAYTLKGIIRKILSSLEER